MNGRLVRWLASLAHRERTRARPGLTIVRHHRVYADGERPLYRLGVAERVLEAQVALLARAGRAPLTVAEGLARLAEGRPGHAVAFTFDDGYRDNVTRALPILERHGARATFYLTAGLMDEGRAPWWDVLVHALERAAKPRARVEFGRVAVAIEADSPAGRAAALRAILPLLRVPLAEQDARLERLRDALGVREPAPAEWASWEEAARFLERGMEVGAHTLHHPYLSLHLPESQREEIAGSVERIERRLGSRPAGLAYPGGDHDAVTIAACDASGLAYAVTTRAGDVAADDPRFALRRRGWSDGACLGPLGGFSERLARAELDGAFDRWRGVEAAS